MLPDRAHRRASRSQVREPRHEQPHRALPTLPSELRPALSRWWSQRPQSTGATERRGPEEVQDAFDDAIKAREDEQRIINEANAYRNGVVPQARGDAQGLLEKAAAYKTRVVKAAEGETSRFNQLLAEYQRAPEVTRERIYLDTMESVMSRSPKVMIDIESGNNLLFLPLEQLFSGSSAGTDFNQNSGESSSGSTQSLMDEFKRNVSRSRTRETR